MNARSRTLAVFLFLVAALALVACSDDDDPTDPDTDTTPPGVSSVTAVDAAHIDVLFNEPVTRASAEDEGNYSILESPVPSPAASGGGLNVLAAALHGDGRTVTLTTNPMFGVDYRLYVENVEDAHGNEITEAVQKDFSGSTDADNTPPKLVYRKPAPGATNVALGALIEITFSEPVQGFTFGMSAPPAGPVDVQFTSDDQTHFTGTHDPLQKNTTYNLTLSDVMDLSGNAMAAADVEWSFKTTNTDDNTAPTLVSSVPANLAVNVDVNTVLSLTFSEPIAQNAFSPNFTPEILGTFAWSPDGKTMSFTPNTGLAADTQYELEIFPGDMQDLSGNPSTALYTRVFTTGAALEPGSIAGTITGDPNSSAAGDPTGAFVAAADNVPVGNNAFTVYGATTVAGNNTYTIDHLRVGTYYPMCIMDTANDDFLDPFYGDAIGFYGVDVALLDATPDSVIVPWGTDVSGINFKLYDPTAVWGQVSYEGAYGEEEHSIFVGLFESSGFDPGTSVPVAAAEASWPGPPFYIINTIEAGPIASGSYYIGGFLDANDSGEYEPAIDPAGLFGGNPPTAVNIAGGTDAPNSDFLLLDPVPGANAAAVQWTTKPHATWLRNLSRAVRAAQLSPK